MTKSILITGGKGKLAGQLIKYNHEKKDYIIHAPTKEQLDISCVESIFKFLKNTHCDYIIHAAAYTKPMKKHSDNPDISIKTNIIGTSNIALGCLEFGNKLVYISTDYVYPGTDGNYSEGDPLSPFSQVNDGISKYGWSKLGGECSVRLLDSFLILRACLCDYPFPHPSALIDVKKSLIYHHEAAPLIFNLLDENGIINIGGISQSVFDFAKNTNPNIQAIRSRDIKDVMIAPNTSMNTQKLQGIIKKHEN